MEQRFDLSGGGWLTLREEGARVHLSVYRPMDGAGLYKVWLRGGRGELLLGTLIPEGQSLRLQRTMSRDSLSAAGCWPVTGGRVALSYSFSGHGESGQPSPWRWERWPGQRLRDPVLREAAGAQGPMLLREGRRGFLLAAPFDPQRPFPLAPLFCLGRTAQVDGTLHVVFAFDPSGDPIPPWGIFE